MGVRHRKFITAFVPNFRRCRRQTSPINWQLVVARPLEEYYTGTLAISMINEPNEGLLIMYSIYIATSIVGSTAEAQPNILFPQLNINRVFVLFTVTCATVQCFFSDRYSVPGFFTMTKVF
uniref:Uncharacterized protein n=1 Tax=Hyaloperonospora arabidopsidis (strain Emoy2) TaxID=559515 RepID=M4BT03_HYAAE